jgi:hypothetical protein
MLASPAQHHTQLHVYKSNKTEFLACILTKTPHDCSDTAAHWRGMQELRMRRVAQEHIDAALASVFGDSKQLAGREPLDEQQESECEHR